jgi:hypothetical protein
MKKRILTICIAAFISVIFIPSCKKYEDGPAFSLRTKKARISGDWKIESVSENGVDQTSLYTAVVGAGYTLDLEKDGVYRVTGNFPDKGKWKLGEDKDDIYMTSDDPGSKEEAYRILRLKNKELWLRMTESNGTIIVFKYKQ